MKQIATGAENAKAKALRWEVTKLLKGLHRKFKISQIINLQEKAHVRIAQKLFELFKRKYKQTKKL